MDGGKYFKMDVLAEELLMVGMSQTIKRISKQTTLLKHAEYFSLGCYYNVVHLLYY